MFQVTSLVTMSGCWILVSIESRAPPGQPALAARLLRAVARERVGAGDDADPWRTPGAVLSPREQEVLLTFGSGLRVGQIARTLGVSVHTARAHLKAIMRKLDVHSQTALLERLRADGCEERTEDANARR